MTRVISLLTLCLFYISAHGQRVYTVRNGAWEDSSTWYNQIVPQGSGDSIYIYNHVSLHTDLYFISGYLEIDTAGSLCGNNWLSMDSGCYLYNAGFLGLYGFNGYEISAQNVYTGIIDLGDGGGSFNGYTGEFSSNGCVDVHYGPEMCLCLNDSTLNIYLDSTINFTVNQNIIFLQMDSDVPADYYFNFGDGTGASTNGYYETHEYPDTGYYPIQIIINGCCFNDTLNTLIYIDSLPVVPPPPPPPCEDSFTFRFGPSPADHNFAISWQFCEDKQVTIKLYTLNGQLVFEQSYNTVAHLLNESIDSYFLPSACYILSIEAGSNNIRKMIAVIHDY